MKKKLIVLMSLLLSMSLSGCLATHEESKKDDDTATPDNNNQNQGNNNQNQDNNNNNGNTDDNSGNQNNNNDDNGNQGQNEHGSDDLSLDNDGSVNHPYTVEEACKIAKTLDANEQTPLKYFIKGNIVKTSAFKIDTGYGNATFHIKDQGGSSQFYCYRVYYLNNQKFTDSNALSEGDTVVVFSAIVNYAGNTPETTPNGSAYIYQHNNNKSSSVPEQGFPKEDSSISLSTISTVLNANTSWKTEGANNAKKYRIKGIAQWAVNANYGNFDLVDSTGYIYVHGATATKQKLKQDGTNGYVINNDGSYKGAGIKAGDEVTIEGWYAYHKYTNSYGVPQFTGYITNVTPKGASKITGKNYTATESYSGSYYSSIGNKSGNDLLVGLHNLMDSTHTSWTSYDGLYSTYSSLSETKDFYSNTSVSSNNRNREHVWPQSLSGSSSVQLYGEDHGGSDLLHVRLADKNNNSTRSNSMFGPIYGESSYKTMSYSGSTANKYTSNVFEPSDAIKGDVARIIMYMYMHYNIASNVNNLSGWVDKSYYGEMHVNWVMGTQDVKSSFALLRLWNANDPVSQEEIARNNYAENHQGNRNPFIDHPSYADKIWG